MPDAQPTPQRRTYSRWTDSQLFAASLIAPVFLYGLLLQVLKVTRHAELIADTHRMTGAQGFALLGSVLAFNLFFALLGGSILLIRDQGSRWWVAAGALLQCTALVKVLIDTTSYSYFVQTLDALDGPLLAQMLAAPDDLSLLLAGEVSRLEWAGLLLLAGSLFTGPWLLRMWSRRWKAPPYPLRERRSRAYARLALSLSPLALAASFIEPGSGVRDRALVRDPVVMLLVSAFSRSSADELAAGEGKERVFKPGELQISRVGTAPLRNVVIVVFESTRAIATTPYSPSLATTPFLDKLAKGGLVVDRAYAVMPATAKALTAILCGLTPTPMLEPRMLTPELLGRCLPRLLREQGYDTLYMQTAGERFENRLKAVASMGYEKFILPDELPHEGMEVPNFLGYEDDSMLQPSEAWLRAHGKKPFLATYLTVNAHHDYERLVRRGEFHFTGQDEMLDRYLNNVHVTDLFLEQLFEQYKRLGLYEDTLFVLVGDHGEGFGEHGRRGHNTVPYEEGLRVPLVLVDPSNRMFVPGHLPGPVSQVDIMVTVLRLLGFKISKGEQHGHDLFTPSRDRVLYMSCAGGCSARVTAGEAFIFHEGRRPDELYDLNTDPNEQRDLASTYPNEVSKRREDLVAALQRLNSFYYLQSLRSPKTLAAAAR
jgi:lipoteichoic acid synthase